MQSYNNQMPNNPTIKHTLLTNPILVPRTPQSANQSYPNYPVFTYPTHFLSQKVPGRSGEDIQDRELAEI